MSERMSYLQVGHPDVTSILSDDVRLHLLKSSWPQAIPSHGALEIFTSLYHID